MKFLNSLKFIESLSFSPFYDDDTTPGGSGNDTMPSGQGDDDKPKFSQKQVNDFLAKERKQVEAKNAPLIKELEQLRAKTGLTDKEKKSLEERIEALKTEHLTDSEKKQRDLERVTKDSETKINEASTERDFWKNSYQKSMISREISDAASNKAIKAYRPQQLVQLLKDDSKLVEKLDKEGKPTGEFEVKTKFRTEKDGEIIELELTPLEVLKRLREDENYMNLFEFEGKGGIGGSGGQGGNNKTVDYSKMTPEQWKEARKTQLK